MNAVALVVLTAVVVAAIFAPYVATHDPTETAPRESHRGPSATHWLGTDHVGRDVFSRLVYGARASMQVGILAVATSVGIGVPFGLLAGLRMGVIDEIIMRAMDGVFAIPSLLLALAIAAVLGTSLGTIILAIGVATAPGYARLMRSTVLQVQSTDYVLAARAIGSSGTRIALVHVLPNSIQPVIVQATLSLGFAIVIEASLSFLGVGIQPPAPSWGSMLRDGYRFLDLSVLQSLAPGMAIFLTVLSVNLVGDGLREALDPRARGT